MKSQLHQKGYALVTSVMSKAECENIKHKIIKEQLKLPHMAHSDVIWELRTDSRILKIFEELWETDDLIVGFDGVNHRKHKERGFVLPWHVDQDESHPDGVQCYQSILAIEPSNQETGTICVLPASHRHHRSLANRLADGLGGWEFVEIPEYDRIFNQCLSPIPIEMEVGDLFIWESRTAHCVIEPLNMNTERLVMYLSYVPKCFCSEFTRKERMNAYQQGISSTHWPHRFIDRGDPPYGIRDTGNFPDRLKLV